MKNLLFRLKGDRKPVSWSLPIKTLLLPKQDENGNSIDKRVHYMPGASSIFVEDYKGQGEAQDIIFEDGEIEVRPSDILKIEILKRHPWYGVHYELVDDDANASQDLEKFALQEKALDMVNIEDMVQLKAVAMVVIGQQAYSYTDLMCKAELKRKAFNDPAALIEEFNKPNYDARYIVSLAMLRGIIKTGLGNTAVVWGDTGQTIIRIAVGENPIDQMSEFISVQSEDSMITLQRLTEKAQGVPVLSQSTQNSISQSVDNTDALAKKDLELSEKDKEIEELKKQLAAKQDFVPSVSSDSTKSDLEVGDGKEDLTPGEGNTESKENLTVTSDAPTLDQLQEEYVKLSGGNLPPNKKNDAAWLSAKIEEFKAAQK